MTLDKSLPLSCPQSPCLQVGDTWAVKSGEAAWGAHFPAAFVRKHRSGVCGGGAPCSLWVGSIALCFHGCGPDSHLPLCPTSVCFWSPAGGPSAARMGSVGAHALKSTWLRPPPCRPSDLGHYWAGRGQGPGSHHSPAVPSLVLFIVRVQCVGSGGERDLVHPGFTHAFMNSVNKPLLSVCRVPGTCRGQLWPFGAGEGHSGSLGETSARRPSLEGTCGMVTRDDGGPGCWWGLESGVRVEVWLLWGWCWKERTLR